MTSARPHRGWTATPAATPAGNLGGMRRGWWLVMLVAIALVPIVILLIFEGGDDAKTADSQVTTAPALSVGGVSTG